MLPDQMYSHCQLEQDFLKQKIKNGTITLAGNAKLKIFGLLSCPSGKQMKKQNRVFFESETEAISLGFRPCGRCMRVHYSEWKKLVVSGK